MNFVALGTDQYFQLMKTFTSLLLGVVFGISQMLHAQTDSLRIFYDATKGGAVCSPSGAAKMYFHSGAGLEPASYWDAVVGDWGQDNGIGQMSATGTTDLWKKVIHLYDYYSLDPQNDTIFNIAVTFRNENATMIGRDYSCNDIYFKGLDTPLPFAEQGTGGPFDGVTLEWVNPVGISTPHENMMQIFPNPATSGGSLLIKQTMMGQVKANLININGQMIMPLALTRLHGSNYYQIKLHNSNGAAVAPGLYFIILQSQSEKQIAKLMVTAR